MDNVLISLQLPRALDDELERLAHETKKSKSELIREGATALIGVYRNDKSAAGTE